MRIIYPYNEILPKKKAHDIFIVHECAALAEAGQNITLLVGSGSKKETLFSHYHLKRTVPLHIKPLWIIRKNNSLGLSWNFPFFWRTQQVIRTAQPDWVFLSVRKQAAYHLNRKIPGVRYLYEVHELGFYPGLTSDNSPQIALEKNLLEKADLITVTTKALEDILKQPPYTITRPIAVVPLAVQAAPLPVLQPAADPLILLYVGQLYMGQGLPTLLTAMQGVKGVHLKVIGGSGEEIANLSKLAQELSVAHSVEFLGFVSPAKLPGLVQGAHAFVAPFENSGRMPYVAHTKLCEYTEWGRPVIAPDLPIVREHFQGKGALLFTPDDPASLAYCISAIKEKSLRYKLQGEITTLSGQHSWQTRAKTYINLLQS